MRERCTPPATQHALAFRAQVVQPEGVGVSFVEEPLHLLQWVSVHGFGTSRWKSHSQNLCDTSAQGVRPPPKQSGPHK